MGVDVQIYRCGIGMLNCGAGPKLLYKSKVVCDVAIGVSAVSAVCFIGILLIMAGVEPNPGPTGAHERNNPLCKNWNRVASGYKHVKTGLTGFISCQIGRRYTFLKVKVYEQSDSVKPCSECTTNTLLPDHGTLGCNQKEKSDCLCQQDPGTRKKCPNNFCGHFYHLIVDDHVEKSPRWSSTDPTKWYDDHFQYAKCFLTTDSSASSMSELDCADLLTIVIHNKYINCKSIKEVKLFQQCWKDQDIIFNSGNFEVTDSELDIYFDHMIHVLEDGKCLLKDPDAMEAVKELLKLKNNLIQLSDEDIDELLQKTSGPTLVYRYQYLLIEIGTKMIRKLFDVQVGPNFEYYLRRNTDENNKRLIDKLQDLIKKKCITAAQAGYLPPKDKNPSSTNFDISLLTCLLRNVCGMRPAEDLVWIQPSGHSVEADVTRLKECRNNLSHSGTVFISSTDFTTKWNELCEILKRLNQDSKGNSRITNLQNLIDESQNRCIDENKREDFTKVINAWKKMDADVIAELERHDQGMNRRFDNVDQTLKQLRVFPLTSPYRSPVMMTLMIQTTNQVLSCQKTCMLTVKVTVDAQSQTASEEAQSSILDAAKTYASDGHEITCDPEVQTACNNILSDMEGKGVVIDSVNTGSILITFRCPTRLALVRIRLYITDQMYREKLKVLENAVSKCIMSPVELNISIAPEHTDSALMQTDIAANKKSVVLTFKCRGSEGVRNAVGFLTNGSSNKMRELSNALSRSVGEEIKLHTTVDFDKLDSDGNIALQEEQYKEYIFRYQYLLVEIGTAVMRKVFDFKVGSDIVKHLSANNNKFYKRLQSLILAKIITADQAQHLPPIDNSPKSTNMDITLLAYLLRNVCGLRGDNDPVWKNPPPTDFSLEADLARLMECQNNLHHSGTVFISETDFTDKWKELSQILIRLNTVCGIPNLSSLINAAEKLDVDEELKKHHDQDIQAWNDIDNLIDRGVEELKLGQSEIKEGQSDMKRDIAEIKEGRPELKTNLENVERNLAEVRQKISNMQQGTKRQLEHIEQTLHEWKPKQLDMDESDLRNRLVKIYKEKCCTLPVSPLCGEDEDKMELLTIYQRPNMCRIPYHRSQQEEENYPISSYKEIFFKDDKPFRNIYVTGDAGVGKTSFCQCMAFLWCKCGENIGNDNLQKDIDFMKIFDFVFYISLRDTVHEDVLDMIIEQYFYTTPMQEEIIKLMLKNVLLRTNCLIILDALDEWSPQRNENKNRELPRQFPSEKCTYLTTCRPYKVENVRLSRKDLDIQIQMTGITKNSTECFVKEIVNHINDKTKDNKNPDDFIRDIKECGLQEQIRIPMIAAHLVAVWFDHKLTDVSRALIYSNIVNIFFKKAEKRQIEFPLSAACTIPLPDILTKLVYFKKYFSLLEKMCLLSFRSLFKQDESVLVFTEEQLMSEPYFVSMEEINFLCKIGILSKNKVISQFGKQEQKLSYLHKSYLEFFASLFVSSFDLNDAFDDVVKKWKSINDVVQYSNFFLLLAGFSCHRTELLFKNIYCTISDDLRLCRRNAIFHYHPDSYRKQIKSLQNMVINCLKEVCGSNDANVSFRLEDFIFDGNLIIDDIDSDDSDDSDGSDAVNSNVDRLKNNLCLNRKCVKSIHSVSGEYLEEFDKIKHLQCLNVGKVLPADYKQFTQFILKNKSTLHTVCIEGESGTEPLIPELPVRSHHRLSSVFWSIIGRQSLQHLTSLSLSEVKMQHNSLHNLVKFLSDNVLIENIKLSCVYCDNHQPGDRDCTLTLNLPYHTKLTSLHLWNVNISCNDVNISSLKYIILAPRSERIVSCYIDVFNCIKDSQLEYLGIDGCNWLDFKAGGTLECTVNTLPCIKVLRLHYMKLPDDVLLRLHPHVTQVEIELIGVTMSRQCFHCFIESCVNNKSVIKVELDGCKIAWVDGETHRQLSVEESLDYMSEYLTLIPTVNITYKVKRFDGLLLQFETTSCQEMFDFVF